MSERLPASRASLPEVTIPLLSGSWRREVAAITEDMFHLAQWLQAKSKDSESETLVEAVAAHLRAVRNAISKLFGVNQTAILGHIHAAQENILRLAPVWYVRSSMPKIVAHARMGLDSGDVQLSTLEVLANKAETIELTEDEQQTVVSCLSGANEQIRRSQSRLQSFRNVVAASAGFLLFLVLVVGLISVLKPSLFPICFVYEVNGVSVVNCPSESSALLETGGQAGPAIPDVADVMVHTVATFDILFIEFLGFLGAAMSAALALKNVRGSSDPYSIPVALLFLKLPTGALTALVGIVLIRAGLVPGIENLKSSAEIIAWALAFGFSQQLLTGVVDRQARSVLEQAGASLHQPLRAQEIAS